MIRINSLKNVKKSNKIAALVCIIITLILSYMLYASEYHYSDDKEMLTTAINDFVWPYEPIDKYKVLEMKKADGMLFATFKDQINENNYGIAVFVKGFNNRYRIIKTNRNASDYSSVVQVYEFEINNKSYYAVNGYNLSKEIAFYGLNYYDYYSTVDNPEEQKTKSLQFEVEDSQFLEIYLTEELDEKVFGQNDEESYKYRLRSATFYNVQGIDITEGYRIASDSNQYSSSSGKAELFLLYIYIGIILVFGAVLARYFLLVINVPKRA